MKIAWMTNFVPPYRKSLFEKISESVDDFWLITDAAMESNRLWQEDLPSVNIIQQKSISVKRTRKHRLGFKYSSYSYIPIRSLITLVKLKPDIIISVELGLRSLFALLYSKLNGRTSLIIHFDGSVFTEIDNNLIRIFRRFLLKNANGVIVNGSDGRKYIKEIDESLDHKIKIIPYSFDPCSSEHGNAKWDENSPKMIYIGTLSERKGICRFLEDLMKYATKNSKYFSITIVGEENDYNRSDIENFGNSYLTIKYVGFQPATEVARLMCEHDICVVPSIADSWSLVVNESLALGIPVLGSIRSQAVSELIDGNNGWKYDPLKSETLFDCLNDLSIISIMTMKEMRTACRNSVSDKVNSVVYKLYVDLCEEHLKK